MNLDHTVRAVLLDVGGVLMVPDPIRVGAITAAHGGTDDTEALIRAHFGAVLAAEDGTTLEWPRYERELPLRAGVPEVRLDAASRAITAAYSAGNLWSHPLPGGRDGLAALVAAGLRIGIVSNSDGTVEQTLRDTGICQVGAGRGVPVEVLIDSHVVGVAKPDPAIFGFALEAMGVPAEDTVYVGDTRTFDIAGARAAGLHPVHLDPYSFCPEPEEHDHATSVLDLAGQLADQLTGQREAL